MEPDSFFNFEEITEDTLVSILLCDPITTKGKECLNHLGLSTDTISEKYFYDKLCVKSSLKCEPTTKMQVDDDAHSIDKQFYHYVYDTYDSGQRKELKRQSEAFDKQFVSDAPKSSPIILLGVAGNGKTIETHHRLYDLQKGKNIETILFDFEDTPSEITYVDTFSCPQNTLCWIAVTKIFDTIMKTILKYSGKRKNTYNNFKNLIYNNGLASNKMDALFNSIEQFEKNNIPKEAEIFNSIKNQLDCFDKLDDKLHELVKILAILLFCIDPTKKNYIVLDNIEEHIRLNGKKIQIPDQELAELYRIFGRIVPNLNSCFDRIEKDLGWKAFKIVIVVRRTSIIHLGMTLQHAQVRRNCTDITGHYQIDKIWKEKEKWVLREFLRDKFLLDKNQHVSADLLKLKKHNTDLIEIFNRIILDGYEAAGTDYQALIAPLMGFGLRRNARAQVHAAIEVSEILSQKVDDLIDYKTFEDLISLDGYSNARYMFRRALVELQFKWSIIGGEAERWNDLGIGNLNQTKRITQYEQCDILYHQVVYKDKNRVTYCRRILSFLYNHYENNKNTNNLFPSISLAELMRGVMIPPQNNKEFMNEDEFHVFARVIIALSNMSNEDTKSAPFIILWIDDEEFHRYTSGNADAEDRLVRIMTRISENNFAAAEETSVKYRVRITDAGKAFLLYWMASFSFMASLYCYTIKPLFFLRNSAHICYLIETVYRKADDLCSLFENEARRFCGCSDGITIRNEGYLYLPKIRGEFRTFRHHVKEKHINHLFLYRDFIVNNADKLKFPQREKILQHIDLYISQYKKWEDTGEGARECF